MLIKMGSGRRTVDLLRLVISRKKVASLSSIDLNLGTVECFRDYLIFLLHSLGKLIKNNLSLFKMFSIHNFREKREIAPKITMREQCSKLSEIKKRAKARWRKCKRDKPCILTPKFFKMIIISYTIFSV